MLNKELEEKSYKVSSKVLPAKKTNRFGPPSSLSRGRGQGVGAGGVEFLKLPKKGRG